MGFYGNITNTSNTTFQFDRIYPNRLSMDANVNNDGIFIGRYVLVEYERKAAYPIVYTKTVENNLQFYSSPNCEDITRIRFGTGNDQIDENDIVKSYPEGTNETTTNGGEWPIDTDNIKFYYCNGSITINEIEYATFVEITEEEEVFGQKSDYILNYAIDENHYYPQDENERRTYKGYDSTVWTKVSETSATGQLITKYVNIADLNSVVPTFDIAEDAPTMNALTPHFDADSTNVYYKLHMQTPYGFRIKAADNEAGSDLKTIHITAGYDENNNMITKAKTEVNADIYYNDAGFDESKSSFKEANTDIITILPTGTSGKTYSHYPDLPADMEMEKWGGDIQELSIRLPSIGNTISKVWDIIYDNNNGFGIDGGTRYRDLDWQYVINDITGELRETKDGGKTVDVSTIAGCINSVHNLMGQIIVGSKPEANQAKKDYIYFDGTYYWKIVDKYIYSEPISEIDKNIEYYVISDTNNVFTKGTVWNNNVAIPNGVAIGTRTIQNEWKQLDLGEHFDTLHGQILKLNHIYSDALVDSETRDDDTIVGNINRLNDIIAKFAELVPGEIMVVDEYGRMHSAGYTTAQPFASKNYGKSINGANSTSYDSTEDRWIQLDIDTKYDNPAITIAHKHTPVNDTVTTSNKNVPVTSNGGINNDTDDDLQLYTPIIDSMGHIVGKNIETVTLPYGYKYFQTNGLSTEKGDIYSINVAGDGTTETKTAEGIENDVEAHNTQDTLSINPANKWIQTKLVETSEGIDELTIAHEIHSIDVRDSVFGDNESSHSNANKEEGAIQEDNLTIYDWSYDEAGHITSKRKHTYTLPYGFKTINVGTNTTDFAAPDQTGITGETADNTQDSLTFTPTNKWIKMVATGNDEIKFGHELSGIEAKEHSSSDTNVADFGDTFNILKFTTDKAGHITAVGEENIKIPSITFTNDTTGNVVTNMNYSYNIDNKTGTFTETRENIGTLTLGTHTGTTITTNGLNIISSDTISNAFNKTQTHINNLNLNSTDSDLEWITDVTQVNGQIAIARKGTNSLKLKDYSALTSVSAIGLASNDTLNSAFGKLEYRIKEEEKNRKAAINELDVTDTIDDTKYVSGVSESDGKITVSRAGTDTLQLSNYSIASTGQDIANNDTINGAFGKLQKQIKNIIGNGEIAANFDTIKEIADWLKTNDSNADKIIDSIATLNSGADKVGSVANSIKTEIDKLNKSDTAVAGQYVSAVSEANGVITVTRADLPTYATVAQGKLAATAIQPTTEFVYTEKTVNTETGEILTPEIKMTIAQLVKKVAALEKALSDNGITIPTTE